MTMDLNLLFPFSSPWLSNQDDLDLKFKTLWYPFALVKENLFQIFTSDLLQS